MPDEWVFAPLLLLLAACCAAFTGRSALAVRFLWLDVLCVLAVLAWCALQLWA